MKTDCLKRLLLCVLVVLMVGAAVVQAAPPAQAPVVHVVRWGETLALIAARYGTTVQAIAQANGLTNPNYIYAGQRLIISGGGRAAGAPASSSTIHVVRAGETLSSIAYRYGTTVSAIVQANGIYNPSYIYTGQRLVIPGWRGVASSSPVNYYTVRRGDTLAVIAYRYGTTVWAIAQANNLRNPSLIYVGQQLAIPGTAPPRSAAAAAPPAPSPAPPASSTLVPSPAPSPTPQTVSTTPVWEGRIVTNTFGTQVTGAFQAIVRVSVEGQKDLPVTIRSHWWSTTGKTGTKPEWGPYALEFSPLKGGYYTIEPEGLGTSVDIFVDGWGWAFVEFKQRMVQTTATPPPTSAPPSGEPTPQASPTPIPPVPVVKPFHMNSPEYGMQVFLWWRPETADRDLQKVKEAGFTWVKQAIAWRDVEGSGKGHFDWSRTDRLVGQVNQYGLDLIARLDNAPDWAGGGPAVGPMSNYQDFADFCYALASRYKGRIRAYQIWNEPNLNVAGRSEWGGHPPDPAGYTELLKRAYEAIKRADPNAMVISAGLSPTSRWDDQAMPDVEFLKGMYAAGAKPYFDVLGAHGAGYKVPPETDPWVVARDPALNNNDPTTDEFRKRVYCFRRVEDLRQVMVENGDGDKQIALLEFGWTTDRVHPEYAWFAVSEQEQADYLVRAYQYAKAHWSPWIGVMSLIYMPNPDWTEDKEEYWWAIALPSYPGFSPRPAYTALKNMPK